MWWQCTHVQLLKCLIPYHYLLLLTALCSVGGVCSLSFQSLSCSSSSSTSVSGQLEVPWHHFHLLHVLSPEHWLSLEHLFGPKGLVASLIVQFLSGSSSTSVTGQFEVPWHLFHLLHVLSPEHWLSLEHLFGPKGLVASLTVQSLFGSSSSSPSTYILLAFAFPFY